VYVAPDELVEVTPSKLRCVRACVRSRGRPGARRAMRTRVPVPWAPAAPAAAAARRLRKRLLDPSERDKLSRSLARSMKDK
jgi:hypothetical protein